MSDVISKLISANNYTNGDAVVFINNIVGGSGANLVWEQSYTTLSGVENSLTSRFDDINYYSGSGVSS